MLSRSCKCCSGSRLVASRPLKLLCLAAAVAWCIGDYVVIQGFLDDPSHPTLRPRGVRLTMLIAIVPPIALIWLAFSDMVKRGCPECCD